MIEAFGEVVIGGNFIVGLVVFTILMNVNFIVITKGTERISEATARFTLDALPGKQMAIDADLNAGIITQEEGKQRRQQAAKEADFYGAMGGTSKFVRGDAIAGILILLAIGDGLVAQIPALLLPTAAAIIVTRINESLDITTQVQRQLLASPSVLYTVAGIVLVLGLVPGMPHLALISFAALIGFIDWRVSVSTPPGEAASLQQVNAIGKAMDHDRAENLAWEDIPLVERLSISLGYKLLGLVNEAAGAPLAQRVRGVRQSLSESLGFLLPEVQIRDSPRLKGSQYKIYIHGQRFDGAEVHADRLMAIPSPELYGETDGFLGSVPAYRMPVV